MTQMSRNNYIINSLKEKKNKRVKFEKGNFRIVKKK